MEKTRSIKSAKRNGRASRKPSSKHARALDALASMPKDVLAGPRNDPPPQKRRGF